jgi:hypothetical protein
MRMHVWIICQNCDAHQNLYVRNVGTPNIVRDKRSIFDKALMRETIKPEAQVKTDIWLGYKLLKKDFANLIQVASGEKGENYSEMYRAIMDFKRDSSSYGTSTGLCERIHLSL